MMKRTLRSIATLLTLSLMFVILATSVFAASTSVTEYAYSNWRGNGSATARNNDEVIMAIGEGEKVTFKTSLTMTVDANTSAHDVTATSALRQKHWYGYSTLISLTLCDDYTMSNSSTSSSKTYSFSKSKSATTSSTGDYYMIANTSGASSAFYNKYNFTTTYTVAS